MDNFFTLLFGLLACACAALEMRRDGPAERQQRAAGTPAFRAFRNNYLLVYTLAMAGDWLQGPYVRRGGGAAPLPHL